jgi:hypothetical protein
MESEHSIEDLRATLKTVRRETQSLEASSLADAWDREIRRRIAEARIQETAILAQLAQSALQNR